VQSIFSSAARIQQTALQIRRYAINRLLEFRSQFAYTTDAAIYQTDSQDSFRTPLRIPSQLHKTTRTRREKPVINLTFRLGKKLRNATIRVSQNGRKGVGIALNWQLDGSSN
jgi:hypothetical protein